MSGDCENVRISATAVSGGAGASLEPCTLAPRHAGKATSQSAERAEMRVELESLTESESVKHKLNQGSRPSHRKSEVHAGCLGLVAAHPRLP